MEDKKKFNYKINGLKKKVFKRDFNCKMDGLKKKFGAKGQQRLGQARPPREPN